MLRGAFFEEGLFVLIGADVSRNLISRRLGGSAGSVGSSSARVATRLREAIVSGLFDPGDRLKQEELMRHFDVSVGPVREALRTLESEGIVVYAPRRGYSVAAVSLSEAEIVLPVRLIVEQAAFAQLRDAADEKLLTLLDDLVAEMRSGARAGSAQRVNDADMSFHEAVVTSCSASPQAVRLWQLVMSRVRMLFNVLTPLHSELSSVADEHLLLLATIRGGSGEELRSLVEEHVYTQPFALLERAWRTEDHPAD